MAVTQRYKDLVQEWAIAGINEHGGQNSFSRHTERVLAKWELPGFASGVLGRWKAGNLVEGLEDDTLRRIGLLKGFSKDPMEAQQICYQWLNDPDFDVESAIAPVPVVPAPDLEAWIRQADLSAGQLREIANTATDLLYEKAANSHSSGPEPPRSRFSQAILDRAKALGHDLEQIATISDIPVERLRVIIEHGGWVTEGDMRTSMIELMKLGQWYGENGAETLAGLLDTPSEISSNPDAESKNGNGSDSRNRLAH